MEESTVYRTWDESFAEMAVDILRAEGIAARKVVEVSRRASRFTMDGLGEIAVLVPEEDAQASIDILSVRFSEDDRSDFDEGEFDGDYGEEKFSREKFLGGEFGRYDDEDE